MSQFLILAKTKTLKMSPKEISSNLIESFKRWHFQAQPIQQDYFAKECALIAVNLIIEVTGNFKEANKSKSQDYWKQVKEQIESRQ
jgi:hypothetical protein